MRISIEISAGIGLQSMLHTLVNTCEGKDTCDDVGVLLQWPLHSIADVVPNVNTLISVPIPMIFTSPSLKALASVRKIGRSSSNSANAPVARAQKSVGHDRVPLLYHTCATFQESNRSSTLNKQGISVNNCDLFAHTRTIHSNEPDVFFH